MAYNFGTKYTGIPSSTLDKELFILTAYLGSPVFWPIYEASFPTAEDYFENFVAWGNMVSDFDSSVRLELASPAKALFTMPY
jgi:hypothetical protein